MHWHAPESTSTTEGSPMTPPTVDRFRYPWRRLVPGDTHSVIITRSEAVDLSANQYELVMVDAFTGTPVTGVDYTIDYTLADLGTIAASAIIPADLNTTGLYELRFRETVPSSETLIAGPVVFAPSTVPVP